MTDSSGLLLFQRVAERIVAHWLDEQGRVEVKRTGGRDGLGGRAVDLTYAWEGSRRRIKVKADPYFGTDAMKIADRDLCFYRRDESSYAFEAVANAATREPGWMFDSGANDLYYYYLAIGQPEEEVAALASEPDEVLFAELQVERDELVIMPMRDVRAWFAENYERYAPRPVMIGGISAWYRLVPRRDLEGMVESVRSQGPIFRALSR